MSKQKGGSGGILLNVALVVLGLAVVVLLYSLVSGLVSPRTSSQREENPAQLVGEIIQVEVRNGSGVSGIAAQTTRYLRRNGFDVVEVGDYKSFDVARSMVIDRVGNLENARRVASALGIAPEQVKQEIDLDLYLDASIVLGMDYSQLKPFEED
jgi:hypothetical protein